MRSNRSTSVSITRWRVSKRERLEPCEQLSWLDRLAQALKEKVVLDDDVFKTGNFHRRGGRSPYYSALMTTSTACWISSAITSGTS